MWSKAFTNSSEYKQHKRILEFIRIANEMLRIICGWSKTASTLYCQLLKKKKKEKSQSERSLYSLSTTKQMGMNDGSDKRRCYQIFCIFLSFAMSSHSSMQHCSHKYGKLLRALFIITLFAFVICHLNISFSFTLVFEMKFCHLNHFITGSSFAI